MSLIKFNTETHRYNVVIPRTKNLPPNPHIIYAPVALERALAPPSETDDTNSELSPESRNDKGLRYSLLGFDQRSFFTGSAAADLQAAHIINAIRSNQIKKDLVQAYLSQQKLYDPTKINGFVLDDSPNAILLEASLHVHWDLYGTFCIVPTEENANAMLRGLQSSNESWQRIQLQQAGRRSAPRPLDISKPPFAKPYWEIVVLHPHALLPGGQPLAIMQNRPLYRRGQTESPATPTWRFWVASSDHLSSLEHPDEHLNSFLATDLREEFGEPPICSLAMVINAHCKLEQFLQNNPSASDRVKKYGLLMSELVKEIFFVPDDGYVNVAEPRHPPATVHPNLSQSALPAPIPMPGGIPAFSVPGYFHEFPSDSLVEAPEPITGEGSRDEVEAPEIPDTDGLTKSEFQLVALKANDPRLDAKERADAAMLMLFGTHRYANPYDRLDI